MAQPIIIVGANGGIGEALAHRLADKGEKLILTARDASSLPDISGAEKLALEIDDEQAITDLIEKADEGEGIKGIVYAVGTIVLKPLKATKIDDFTQTYDVNVLGAVRILKAAEKSLKAAEGQVVLFSTVAVQQGFPSHTVIATAKGAIEALTRSLAAEWAPKVRVNCIAPSLTDTNIAKIVTSSDQMKQGVASMHPIPRLGQPDDSAAAAEFLLSDDSSWVTGQVLHVDGGRSSLRVKG